jgi:hypothetical protein
LKRLRSSGIAWTILVLASAAMYGTFSIEYFQHAHGLDLAAAGSIAPIWRPAGSMTRQAPARRIRRATPR